MEKTLTIAKSKICNHSIEWDYNKGKDVKYISSKDFNITIKSNDKEMCEYTLNKLINFFEENEIYNSEMISDIEEEKGIYILSYSIPYYYKNLNQKEITCDYELEEIEEIYKEFKKKIKEIKSEFEKENQKEEIQEQNEVQKEELINELELTENKKFKVNVLLYWLDVLEESKLETIEKFMTYHFGKGWKEKEATLKLAKIFENTMEFDKGRWSEKEFDIEEFIRTKLKKK